MNSSKLTGINWNLAEDNNFLSTTACRLATSIGADHVLIGELASDTQKCRSLAYVVDGKPADNVEYPLEHTPCCSVYCDKVTVISDRVQHLFPQDHMLVELAVNSYVGVPLKDRNNSVIGILTALLQISTTIFGKPVASQGAGRVKYGAQQKTNSCFRRGRPIPRSKAAREPPNTM